MAPVAKKKSKKKAEIFIKLQIKGGSANPAPPIGPALGQRGVNIKKFCDEFNAATQDKKGDTLPVIISVFADKSFEFLIKEPPVPNLILKASGLSKGAGETGKEIVGKISKAQIQEIAKRKLQDMNARSLEAAMKMVAGTAVSMGIEVVE